MAKRWTLYAHREFTRALRQIPRGLAGLVSAAISALADNGCFCISPRKGALRDKVKIS